MQAIVVYETLDELFFRLNVLALGGGEGSRSELIVQLLKSSQ